jgi:O-antigen/teichoic acid export membrane protein
MLAGSQNVAVLNFRRNLQFARQFWFNFVPSLVSCLVAVTAAFVLRNYWALAIGLLSQHATSFALSYSMEPFRPRFGLSKAREIWSFSVWTLFKNIGLYFNTLVDRIVIGGFAGAAAMGRYSVATDIATVPSQELVGPMFTVLFPVMATVQNHPEKRRRLYLSTLYWSALICTSTAIGVALVADDLVDLLLGPQWQDAKPLIPWLALSYGMLGVSSGAYTALDTIGQPAMSARLQWLRLTGLALAMVPVAYVWRDVPAIAGARMVVTGVTAPTLFLALMKPFDLRVSDFLSVLWRPAAAGLFMALAVTTVNSAFPVAGNSRLTLDILVGAASYVALLMVLWSASGRPDGPERILWTSLRPLMRPVRQTFPK